MAAEELQSSNGYDSPQLKTLQRSFESMRNDSRKRPRLTLESLEIRRMMAVFQVSSTSMDREEVGSLPWAIDQANASSDVPDTIRFWSFIDEIDVDTILPEITGPTVIDGLIMPGNSQRMNRLKITGNGGIPYAFDVNMNPLRSGKVDFHHLDISNFSVNGIFVQRITAGSELFIYDNEFRDLPLGSGVRSSAIVKHTIYDNWFYDSLGSGITIDHWLNGPSTVTSTISGNHFGVEPSGATKPLDGYGIFLGQKAANFTISGNEISNTALSGVALTRSQNGGSPAGVGNKITNNTFENNGTTTGLPIDLLDDGATDNDQHDDDATATQTMPAYANTLLNFPEVTKVEFNGNWKFTGKLDLDAGASGHLVTIEMYKVAGTTYSWLASKTVTMPTAGADYTWDMTVNAGSASNQLATGETVAFLAIDNATGNTSEFSPTSRAGSVVERRIFYNNSKFDGQRSSRERERRFGLGPRQSTPDSGNSSAFRLRELYELQQRH